MLTFHLIFFSSSIPLPQPFGIPNFQLDFFQFIQEFLDFFRLFRLLRSIFPWNLSLVDSHNHIAISKTFLLLH